MTEITLRLTIADPVPGMTYSLQDQKSVPVGPVTATDAPLSFDVPVKLSDDNRLTGPFVRREGPERRFVYIAIGAQAGAHTLVSRRAKIDVHQLGALLDQARAGKTLAVTVPGRDKDGLPACATVKPVEPWRAV
ncbi:MAG: hypothetical protein EBR82_01120 [Caulobacteraceae bacterium]|nr:hypothetical protein [Caulobacteraceae bacterium]